MISFDKRLTDTNRRDLHQYAVLLCNQLNRVSASFAMPPKLLSNLVEQVVADIRHLFALLDRFDIAMCHAHLRNTDEAPSQWNESIPFAFPQLNSGVLLYSQAVTRSGFFDRWQEAFHTAGVKKDQVTLRKLLWESELRIYVLPPEYNIRYLKTLRTWRTVEAHPAVLHMAEFHKVVSASWFERLKNNWRIKRVLAALSPWNSGRKGQ